MDKYKDKRVPREKPTPVRRTAANAECLSRRGTLKAAFSETKGKARAKELGMRAYRCNTCSKWHITKQLGLPGDKDARV